MIFHNNYHTMLNNIIQEHTQEVYNVGKEPDGDPRIIQFIPMGLDIETSTIYTRDEKDKITDHFSFMYIWQWSVYDHTFIGRSFEDLEAMINAVESVIKDKYKTIVFIHNMSFEMSFFLKYWIHNHDIKIFARTHRHPMKVEIDNKIIFLDSALITGFSLKKLADNYTDTQKLVGDLDYSKIRLPASDVFYGSYLSDKELQYCINDVQILSEFARYYADNYLSKRFLPMTSTMVASRVVKDKIKELKCQKEVYWMIQNLYPSSKKEYDYIMSYFIGGYTHGMLRNLFKIHYNAGKMDVTSLYPWALMQPEYPISKFRKYDIKNGNNEDIKYFIKNFACLIDVTFKEIKTKTGVTIISKNKSISFHNARWDNGRLYEASDCRIRITNLDFDSFSKHYKWDKIIIHSFLYAEKGYMPQYFRLAIADLYAAKSILKGVAGKEIEYMESKKKLNGQYGSLATKQSFEEIFIDENGNWDDKPKEVNFDEIKKNKNKLPQHAVFCTAVSRNHVLNMIKKLINLSGPDTYIYTDTDSIVFDCTDRNLKLFESENKKVRKNNLKWIEELQLNKQFPEVDFSEMGTFDNELYNKKTKKTEPLKRFKTVGSKRYISEYADGHVDTTVAGMRKGTFVKYCDEHNLDYFDTFDDNFLLSYDDSKKLTTYYCDDVITREVTDYDGNTDTVTAYGYVSLIETSFKMSVDGALKKLFSEEVGDEDV